MRIWVPGARGALLLITIFCCIGIAEDLGSADGVMEEEVCEAEVLAICTTVLLPAERGGTTLNGIPGEDLKDDCVDTGVGKWGLSTKTWSLIFKFTVDVVTTTGATVLELCSVVWQRLGTERGTAKEGPSFSLGELCSDETRCPAVITSGSPLERSE